MSELEPIGQTHATKIYKVGKTQMLPQSQPSGRLLKNPPVVTPEEMPETTMRRIFKEFDLSLSADLQSIIGYLTSYQRTGENRRWEDFRNKIPPPILKLWGDLLIECRRNGFVAPRVENETIVWRQVTSNDAQRNGDLCTMCDRECKRREMIDSGNAKQMRMMKTGGEHGWHEPSPCWGQE